MPNDIKVIFSKNLNKLMDEREINATELSEQTGIPYSTVNDWKNGKKMARGGNLQKLTDYFNINLSALTSDKENEELPSNALSVNEDDFVLIPVLAEISCGYPILAEENISGYRYHLKDTLPSGNNFYLTAKGDSMEPKIPNGADVLIREQATVENGEIAAVLVNGDTEATLKRYYRQGDNVSLIAENPDYPPYIVNQDNPARILGKAIEVSFDL